MSGANYYLVTSLESPGELGSTPPMTPAQLLARISSSETACELARVILLSDDLLQRQALLSGETSETAPAVLSAEQMTDEDPLPEWLTPSSTNQSRIVGDSLWAAYFQHAQNVSRSLRSGFLAQWVAFEVGLRNAVVVARAKNLELDAGEYTVAEELGGNETFSQAVNEWTAAPNPLAAQRVLDQARWNWLYSNDAWFTFSDDELAAYAAKLLLLQRWHRLTEAQQATEAESAPTATSQSI